MRVTKILGTLALTAVAFLTATSESRAGGDEDLVLLSCSKGDLMVEGIKPWHVNAAAPWKWDKGAAQQINDHHAKFKGEKCEGTVKAYVCNGDQCKGPIQLTVK